VTTHASNPPATEATTEGQPVLVPAGGGESVWLRDTQVTFKVRSQHAAGASCLEFLAAPGFDTGLHVHETLEETFIVLEGEFGIRAGERVQRALPGDVLFVPPGVAHGFSNPTPAPAKLLLVMAPADFDTYFVELAEILARSGPVDGDAIAALRARYDTQQLSTLIASEPS
jgi:quercetin dioxygenase-like cupin family protein